MVYSTTALLSTNPQTDNLYYIKRQSLATFLGFGGLLLFATLPARKLPSLSALAYPLAVCLFAAPLIPGIGESAGGAQRWISLGPIRLQPAEFAKPLYILFLAGYYARRERFINTLSDGVIKPLILTSIPCLFLLLQPDFGTSALLVTTTLMVGIVAGTKLRYLFLLSIIGICSAVPLILYSPYRLKRLVGYLSPLADPSGKNYQLIQSLIAIGSGEWFGDGIGSSQQKLHYLPAAHTDFIFSVIGEELGFIGCLGVVMAYCFILWRGMLLARNLATDTFFMCLAVGLTLLLLLPAGINLGVVTGLLPTKGMVLPFLSYGGSSLIASLLIVGILSSLYKYSLKH